MQKENDGDFKLFDRTISYLRNNELICLVQVYNLTKCDFHVATMRFHINTPWFISMSGHLRNTKGLAGNHCDLFSFHRWPRIEFARFRKKWFTDKHRWSHSQATRQLNKATTASRHVQLIISFYCVLLHKSCTWKSSPHVYIFVCKSVCTYL